MEKKIKDPYSLTLFSAREYFYLFLFLAKLLSKDLALSFWFPSLSILTNIHNIINWTFLIFKQLLHLFCTLHFSSNVYIYRTSNIFSMYANILLHNCVVFPVLTHYHIQIYLKWVFTVLLHWDTAGNIAHVFHVV